MRLGVIGCGNSSLNLHLPALLDEPEIELVAAADPTPSRLAMYQERSGLKPEACFSDAQHLLQREDIDAVLVATPPLYRPAIAIEAFKRGKHVVSEKPIAATPAEGWAMARAARAAGRHLAMVHNYYFMPDFVAVKRVLDDGAIGQPYVVTLNFLGVEDRPGAAEYVPVWRHNAHVSGGGVLMDMIHAVYLAGWLMGSQPMRAVSAATDQRLQRNENTEDVALCRFHFETGFSLINMAWGGGPGGIEIMGSEGRLLLFYGDFGTAPFKPAEQLHVYRGYERIPIKLDVGPRPGMRPVWRNFVESV